MKEKVDNNAVIVGDTNTSLLRFIEHRDRRTITRELEQHYINQLDLRDIWNTAPNNTSIHILHN